MWSQYTIMSALTHLFCAAPPSLAGVMAPAETSGFSIGYTPVSTLTRREKLKAAKPKPKPVKPKHKVTTLVGYKVWLRNLSERGDTSPTFMKPNTFGFIIYPKRWLLCYKGVPAPISRFLCNAGQTFPQIFKKIVAKKREQKAAIARYNCETSSKPSMETLTAAMTFAVENQRVRNAFSTIARHKIRSKISLKNTEDLMTGEAPIKPITLVDWPTRSIYRFEARTIARDMITRLTMSSCDFFPNPRLPRNPYTNELLTEGQFYSVVKQLRAVGETHWALEALYSAKYNLKEFDRDMYPKLRRTIHNSIFANPSSDLAKGILLEFIEDEHESIDKTYEKDIYKWAVENHPLHYRVHEWRLQCSKYYKVKHFPGDKEENDAEMERIGTATTRLCAPPTELIERYNAAHEKKYVKLADRVLPPPLGTTITVQLVNTLPVDDHSFMTALAADLLSDTTDIVPLSEEGTARTREFTADELDFSMPTLMRQFSTLMPEYFISDTTILSGLSDAQISALMAETSALRGHQASNDTDDTDDSPSESD